MIIAIAAPDATDTDSSAALELADEWQRRGEKVRLVVSEAPPPESPGIDGTSKSSDGATTLRLGDELQKEAADFERTIVQCPTGDAKFQRAALSVADVALLLCSPGGRGLWPSGRMVEMARNAGEIRPQLHVGYVVTRAALRDAPGDVPDAPRGPVDLPVFDAVLDLSGKGRIRRAPSVATDDGTDGIELLADELDGLDRPATGEPSRISCRRRRPVAE